MFAMSNNSEIPCSFCRKWDSKAHSFSCNPNKCDKLSEWLFDHTQIECTQTKQVVMLPIRYIV